MSFDREDTLKKAEKLLRQGRLEPAIAEYVRIVEQDAGDWITTNTLGDLYVRAGQPDKAAEQYRRIADHFLQEGFFPKAGALYKKLLKLNPEDERSQLNLAEISQKQGLLADAKAHLNAVAARRRGRGDRAGEAEIVVRLGSVDPNDFDARLAAARMLVEMGDDEAAASGFRRVHDDLIEKDRTAEALAALREAVNLNPFDRDGRIALARAAVAEGDRDGARGYLDRETAGDDPALLMALLEIELHAGRLDEVREILPQLLSPGTETRDVIVELAWSTTATAPEAAFVIVEALVEAASSARRYDQAAAVLNDFVARVPRHVPALLRLIDVAVDGGLEPAMNEAQAQLADAYLAAGWATEARVIAEDLVAREPWEREHIDRFRRALVMLKISDPDAVIAERLSGQMPFTATDLFADAPLPRAQTPEPPATPEPGPPEPLPAPEAEPPRRSGAIPLAKFDGPVDDLVTSSNAPLELSAPSPPATSESDEIDLTDVLGGGEDEAEPPASDAPAPGAQSLADAFQNIRRDVAQQGDPDQSAQHLTLGRTYLEMGLPDKAEESLQIAAKSTTFRFEAASLLGRLYRDRGDPVQATEWLERAAEAPAPTFDEGRAILYDLAVLLEERGETARALAIFLELKADAGDYRDVGVRVDRLSRVETETGG